MTEIIRLCCYCPPETTTVLRAGGKSDTIPRPRSESEALARRSGFEISHGLCRPCFEREILAAQARVTVAAPTREYV